MCNELCRLDNRSWMPAYDIKVKKKILENSELKK